MNAQEAEYQVQEFSAQIELQGRLIEHLERNGQDVTSAKIIFDSLHVSLSLFIDEQLDARSYAAPKRPEAVVAEQAPATCAAGDDEAVQPRTGGPIGEPTSALVIIPRARLLTIPRARLGRGEMPMPAKNEINGQLDGTPVVLDARIEKKVREFRPLTQEEKAEFVRSMNDKSRKLKLVGKKSLSGPTAA